MAPPAPKGGGNVLTKKYGPLPLWAWAAVAVGGWYLWKKHQATTTAASTTSTAPFPATSSTSVPTDPLAQAPTGYSGPGVGGGSSYGPGWNTGTASTSGTSSATTGVPASGVASPPWNPGPIGGVDAAGAAVGSPLANQNAIDNNMPTAAEAQAIIASGQIPTGGFQYVPAGATTPVHVPG
jgi:hypothetical protein